MPYKPLYFCPIAQLHETMASLGFTVKPLGVPEVVVGIQCRSSQEFSIEAVGDGDYGQISEHLTTVGADAGLIIGVDNWRFGQQARLNVMPVKLAADSVVSTDVRPRQMRLLQVLPHRMVNK